MGKKLVVIDGNSIANRAFYALPLLNNHNGQHTNAAYGFTTMLLKVLEEQNPTHILVAFDAGKVVFRHQQYREYKAGRQKTPAELAEQFSYIKEILEAFDIPHYQLEGYEADDIIGTLSLTAQEQGLSTVIVTGDKDMLQLVSDQVEVLVTRKGISETEKYTPETIELKYGLQPTQIIDLKGLMGDSSDNIPGIPGVGEKTALKLLHEFNTVERVIAQVEQVSGKKLQEKIVQYQEDAISSKQLATIEREAPVGVTLERLTYESFSKSKVYEVFRKYEFNSLIDRLGLAEEEITAKEEPFTFVTITQEKRSEYEFIFHSHCAFYVELDRDHYHTANIIGFGIESAGTCYFISGETARGWDAFSSWLRAKNDKVVHDLKRCQVSLAWNDYPVAGISFDVLLAAYLLDPSDADFSLSEIAKKYCAIQMQKDAAMYGKAGKHTVTDEQFAEHVAKKSWVIQLAYKKLQNELINHQLNELYSDLELPLADVLGRMERQGIRVNKQNLTDMGEALKSKLAEIETTVHHLAGQSFNINSPKQLGEILFDQLGLPPIKKTKTGYSTSAEVLEKLQDRHEIISHILHYRQLGKLYSTYIEGLTKEIHPTTGRIHTSFNQAITATGRLSSTEPNLQNIPIRLEEGRRIRKAFVPSENGWLILSADYSQIELRVLAHIANDGKLKEAFLANADVHTKTAMDVFGVPGEDVTSLMRRQAKAVNFGIVYGISDYGLSQNLNITRKEAGEFIERYFAVFTGVKAYMESIVKQAKRDGFVTTLLQRRRYLPEINSSNFNLRSFAERTAMNTPIQGTAADIIKKAMVQMDKLLVEKQLKSRMLLQVHDELVFEVSPDEIDELKKQVADVMESAMDLSVPLKVDISYGPTWYDAK
jgi:DNA polymerase-1